MSTNRNITKAQWTNLYRSWRWAKSRMTLPQATAWMSSCSVHDAAILLHLHNSCKQGAIICPNLVMS